MLENTALLTLAWYSWWGFEELSVEMLNHHITFLSGLHSVRERETKRNTQHEAIRIKVIGHDCSENTLKIEQILKLCFMITSSTGNFWPCGHLENSLLKLY